MGTPAVQTGMVATISFPVFPADGERAGVGQSDQTHPTASTRCRS